MDTTSPKPFVFVLMPFSKEFDDVYHLGIKPACEKAGAYAERIDEQIFQESILQRVYNQISKADVVIADMTGRNSNVFYETGYAHALGKPVILLTQVAEDIPFDLKHYAHIIYQGRINDLIPELIKRVTFAIQHPGEATKKPSIEVYVDGKSLRQNPSLNIVADQKKNDFEINFDFYNSVQDRLEIVDFQVGILTSNYIDVYRGSDRLPQFLQPDSSLLLHISSHLHSLRPGLWGWALFRFFSTRIDSPFCPGDTVDIILKIFTDKGPTDFPVIVNFLKG